MSEPFVCETRSNSYGSPYWAFLADPELVVRLAASDLQSAFRRVTLDPVRGLIVLMSPARAHERESELAGDVIKAIASILDMPLVSLRSVRWRRPSDPPNTGPEPDCCFYVGARARAYLAAERSGEADAERFVLHEPPDIVVEVGVTHLDDEKIAGYRERRVAEYWQVDREPQTPAPHVQIVSLLPQPARATASALLPAVTAELVEDALEAAREVYGSHALLERVRDTMDRHGALALPPPRGGGYDHS